ncbi:MAG: Omp28-related outer membrane protein [Bacteroidota bacterium]
MKRLFFLLSFIAFSFLACEEISPVVTGTVRTDDPPPPPPEDQKRQVLVEEFTGVKCVNCPNGAILIEEELAKHGNQLIAISIHAGTFSDPYPQSAIDFRTQAGNDLLNYLGQPFGYPSAVVDRKKFENEFDLQLGANQWAGFIAQEAAKDPKVKIDVQHTFNASSREADIEVLLFVEETINEPDVRLSLLFTENDVVDHQLTPASSPDTDPNYKHKHVLRGKATPFDGNPITDNLTVGSVITESFDYLIPPEWNEDNVKIVAIVSLAGEKKDVLQAFEISLVK